MKNLLSLNQISLKFGIDRRTLGKRLINVEPQEVKGRIRYFDPDKIRFALKKKTVDPKLALLKLQKLKEEIRSKKMATNSLEALYINKADCIQKLGRQIEIMKKVQIAELVDKLPNQLLNIANPAAIRERVSNALARAHDCVNEAMQSEEDI